MNAVLMSNADWQLLAARRGPVALADGRTARLHRWDCPHHPRRCKIVDQAGHTSLIHRADIVAVLPRAEAA